GSRQGAKHAKNFKIAFHLTHKRQARRESLKWGHAKAPSTPRISKLLFILRISAKHAKKA
ncbi:MAG: hypothetical protein ACRER2_04220, partial [Methylococcales bacterium]